MSWSPTVAQVVLFATLGVVAVALARRSTHYAVIASGLLVLFGLVHQQAFDALAEDAFITFRYSRNLAEGQGLVFNAGERVEGYSNFLWLVTLGSLHSSFSLDIVRTARVLGVCFGLGNLILCIQIGRKLTSRWPAGLLAGLFLASSSLFAAWGPAGLEHPMYTFWLLLSIHCALNGRSFGFAVGLALLSLTRFEGVMFLIVFGAWAYVYAGRPLRSVPAIVFLLVYVPYTAWRVVYFGHFLPNTVAAKSGLPLVTRLERGIEYVSTGAASNGALLLVLVVPWAISFVRRRRSSGAQPSGRSSGEVLLLSIAGSYVAFILFIGGDWMPAWRFLYLLTPLAALLAALAWHRCGWFQLPGRRRALVLTLAGAACLHSVRSSFVHPNLVPKIRLWREHIIGLADFGEFLRATVPPTTTIAVQANGALSYHSRLPTIDMQGLTDAHIARSGQRSSSAMAGHLAHDYAYVASRQPQMVHFGGQAFKRLPTLSVRREFVPNYVATSLHFADATNPEGPYVDLLLRRADSARLLGLLTEDSSVSAIGPRRRP